MDLALIVVKQTLVMFIYMMIGFTLFKTKILTKEGSKAFANLLVWVVIPVLIVNSFIMECTPEKMISFLISFGIGAGVLALSMLISLIFFRKKPEEIIATSFSNAAFMGIPLVQAVVGQEGVFFLVGAIALLNVLQGTYGVALLTAGKKKTGWKTIVLNPILIGMVVGIILFLTGLSMKLPYVIKTAVSGIAAANSPIAMIILGIYLAQCPLKSLVTSPEVYWVSLVRLILIPGVTMLLLWPLPIAYEMKLSFLLMAAAPCGSNVAVYAQLHGGDYPKACRLVAFTTVLSIITLPLMAMLAGKLF